MELSRLANELEWASFPVSTLLDILDLSVDTSPQASLLQNDLGAAWRLSRWTPC